jgi:hypothetical protein
VPSQKKCSIVQPVTNHSSVPRSGICGNIENVLDM